MSKDARLPSVRVEIEGLVSPEVDAPEVGPARSSSPARAGALTLAVLVALGAGLMLLSFGGEADPAITQDDEVDAQTDTEQFALTANGGDFHLSIAQSIKTEEEQLRVTAKLLQTPVSSLRGWAGLTRSLSNDLDLLNEDVLLAHDKLGFAQMAEFEGLFVIGDQELFLFSDAGSLSTYSAATGDWSTITSPAFAEVDVRTDGWVATDWPRWYSIDGTTLTIVDLIEVAGTIEAVETTATISMSDEVPRSLESAEILWADLDTLIFATRDVSWMINAPEPPRSQTSGSQ